MKKSKKRKGTIVDAYLADVASYSCTKCGKAYEKDVDYVWVKCDFCNGWFHLYYTDLPVLDDLGDNVDYTCEMCVAKRFPAHK